MGIILLVEQADELIKATENFSEEMQIEMRRIYHRMSMCIEHEIPMVVTAIDMQIVVSYVDMLGDAIQLWRDVMVDKEE